MRTSAPQLLPIFRSQGQGRLLARVYLQPDRPATIAELARELELDDGGLTREADRLERAGLVRTERVGRSRLLHRNEESPYFHELYGLLLKAFGPATSVGEELSGVEGSVDTFAIKKRRALEMAHEPASARRPGAGTGSLDPRA